MRIIGKLRSHMWLIIHQTIELIDRMSGFLAYRIYKGAAYLVQHLIHLVLALLRHVFAKKGFDRAFILSMSYYFSLNIQLFEQSFVKGDLHKEAIELKKGFRGRKYRIRCGSQEVSFFVVAQIVRAGINELIRAVSKSVD